MKPETNDGLNYTLIGCILKVLTPSDILQKGDFIRDYYESPMYSQDGGWDTTYKSEKWCGPKWHRVEDELSGWIGRPYQEYLDMYYSPEEDDEPYTIDEMTILHEIVRIIQQQD